MYFAEVRHFEEIFRQGEQPPGGSAQNEEQEGGQNNARDSDQLAELQKEIINGTWKLVRRETGGKPTDKLAEDGKVLKEAQQSAIEKADGLGERLQDAAIESEPGAGHAVDEGCREALDGRCREVVDPGACSRPSLPSRLPTRRCSSCAPENSR